MINIVVATRDYVDHLRHRLQACHHKTKKAAIMTHVAYGGAVFIEGHGLYPVLAGALAVVLVVEYLGEGH